MQIKVVSAGVALTFGLLASACNYCGADEERAINVSTVDSLTIFQGGVSRKVQMVARVHEAEINSTSFNTLFTAIESGGSGNRAMLLALSAVNQTSNQQQDIVLAIPVDAERGDVFSFVRTFPVEPGLSTTPLMWGVRDLQTANTAEIGFTTSTYSFPPPTHTVSYRASGVNGTVRVTQRQRGYIELELEVQTTDAVVGAATLSGRIQVATERYTPPCT